MYVHTSHSWVDSYQGNPDLTVTFPKATSNWKKYKARLIGLISFAVVSFRVETQKPFIFRVNPDGVNFLELSKT